MLRVRLITDPFDLGSYVEHEPEALLPFLQEQFDIWPPTARLYQESVSQDHDVTPLTEADIDKLEHAEGVYYVVVYPAEPTTILIIAVAVFVIATAALLLLMPKMPGVGNTNNSESANNSIGSRVNKARPNERVPDIFGRLMTVPELLTYPLLVFRDNKEFEYCFMCVGRGEYAIDPDEVYDGKTPLDRMAGAQAQFYNPFTRPGAGVPFLTIGDPIDRPLKNVVRANEVNGQKLAAPNANQMTGNNDIRFAGPASIEANPASAIDFTERFQAGDDLTVTNAAFGGVAVFNATSQVCRFYPDRSIEFQSFDPTTLYQAGQLLTIYNGFIAGLASGGAVVNIDVSGTYEIESVTSTRIYLV
jgi:hypothetical protein